MLLGDEKHDQLTYEQVFALYLIDVADTCQQDDFVKASMENVLKKNRIYNALQLYKIISVFI